MAGAESDGDPLCLSDARGGLLRLSEVGTKICLRRAALPAGDHMKVPARCAGDEESR